MWANLRKRNGCIEEQMTSGIVGAFIYVTPRKADFSIIALFGGE